MTKKQRIQNHVDQIFETLVKAGYTQKSNSDAYSKGNFRVRNEKTSIRFEVKIGKEWKNYKMNEIFYKKDFPTIPEIYLA